MIWKLNPNLTEQDLYKDLKACVVGCGWMGEYYVDWFSRNHHAGSISIVDPGTERLKFISGKYGVKNCYTNIEEMLETQVPDVAIIVTPTAYFKEMVMACVQTGVKGVLVEKPIGGLLSDVDEMIDACDAKGIVFGGGRVQRAIPKVQKIANDIRAGTYGNLVGASVHNWGDGSQISGGGNQHISVLRLLTGAEITEVVAWAKPRDVLESETDMGLTVNGLFSLSNGIQCPVFGMATPSGGLDGGVQVWSDRALINADSFSSPEIFDGFNEDGSRIRVNTSEDPSEDQSAALDGAITSFLEAVFNESDLWVSARDLRSALEVAIAAKRSALLGSTPIKLPLEDRSLALYPSRERWLGKGV